MTRTPPAGSVCHRFEQLSFAGVNHALLLFALALHRTMGLTYTEINFIVSLSAVGMYLCLPILGYLADKYSPALLTLISIWAFCPAYAVNAHLVKAEQGLIASWCFCMAASFCFIGLATSLLYFLSLLTCAKYPNHKSMAHFDARSMLRAFVINRLPKY